MGKDKMPIYTPRNQVSTIYKRKEGSTRVNYDSDWFFSPSDACIFSVDIFTFSIAEELQYSFIDLGKYLSSLTESIEVSFEKKQDQLDLMRERISSLEDREKQRQLDSASSMENLTRTEALVNQRDKELAGFRVEFRDQWRVGLDQWNTDRLQLVESVEKLTADCDYKDQQIKELMQSKEKQAEQQKRQVEAIIEHFQAKLEKISEERFLERKRMSEERATERNLLADLVVLGVERKIVQERTKFVEGRVKITDSREEDSAQIIVDTFSDTVGTPIMGSSAGDSSQRSNQQDY